MQGFEALEDQRARSGGRQRREPRVAATAPTRPINSRRRLSLLLYHFLLAVRSQFAKFPHLLCLSIASSSSSSDRGEMPSTRNPGKLSEAVVSICISST
jgi:hypothetical protein